MRTYAIAIPQDFFRIGAGWNTIEQAATERPRPGSLMLVNTSLFVFEDSELILILPFGELWLKWFDKKWFNEIKNYRNGFSFPNFCKIFERYCNRLIRTGYRPYESQSSSEIMETV